MMKLSLLCAFGLMMTSSGALAQTVNLEPSYYGALGFSGVRGSTETEAGDFQAGAGAVTGRLGARFGRHVGLEGEFSLGVIGDDQDVAVAGLGRFDVDTTLQSQYGVFVVGYLPVSPQTDLFARAGYGVAELEFEVAGIIPVSEAAGSGTVRGFGSADGDFGALGVGVQHFFNDRNGLRAEYTGYSVDDDSVDLRSFSLSFVRRF